MKGFVVAATVAWAALPWAARGDGASPIGKVVGMLADLQAKVIKEGEEAQKVYEEYSEWCEDRASNLGHEIKTGKAEAETLAATIATDASTIGEMQAKIEELAGGVTVDEHDAKAASEIRTAEAKDFGASESELVETVSMLERAIGILEREMGKGGAAMLQLKNVQSMADALAIMVKASVMNAADASRLSSLLQASQQADDEDTEPQFGAPASSAYKGHSTDILETLKGLQETAESQLADARRQEMANAHNYEMLKQSLTDEIRFANKDMEEAKKTMAASEEAKATAESDLAVTRNTLAGDVDTQATLHHDCMSRAEDFEAQTKSRSEELKALAEAKKALQEMRGGYGLGQLGHGQVSFLQQGLLESTGALLASGADLASFEAVRMVRDLAHREKSPVLAQLAHRLVAVMDSGVSTGEDPFAKIKGLISDMIQRLEAEANADATRKAWCDKELKETNEKKTAKTAEIDKLSTRIGRMKAKSATLKEEVAELQATLAKLASAQSAMHAIRGQEHAAFVTGKTDMEKGLQGVKMALKILNDYYSGEDKAHEISSGAGRSIVGLLEVVESDFTKQLAELTAAEDISAAAFGRDSRANEIERTTHDKDVEYKNRELDYLDKESAELSTDRNGVQAELDAVLEYLAKMQEQCIAKAETYGDRKGRREREIGGLKEALRILENETTLLQKRSLRHRGMNRHGWRRRT